MSRLKYWQAGLLAFVVSAVLFLALPLPEALSVQQQVLALKALQLAAVSTACIVVLLRTRRRGLQFDLRPGTWRRFTGSQVSARLSASASSSARSFPLRAARRGVIPDWPCP